MNVFMFPGQGSQAKGMGGALFDEFKELTEKANTILGYSIKELCLDDPNRQLNKTQFTQPALYVVNALSYYKKVEESGMKPDYVIGHSLGEFNALLSAECYDFETGLKLVKKRGELMSEATGGGMAAILNGTREEIEAILKMNNLNTIDLANYNTPSQIVISGLREEVGKAQAFFQQGTMRYYPLNTSGAFHSRHMRAAQKEFEEFLRHFELSGLRIPVISNVTARPYKNDEIIANLSSQIASPVRWSESIQYLMAMHDSIEFEEVGYGEVLTKLVDKIRDETSQPEKDEIRREANGNKVSLKETDKPQQKQFSASEKVNAWNNRYPVGTKVKSTVIAEDKLETRTQAIVLFGHRAAVYMKGYNGYFDLDEIIPV